MDAHHDPQNGDDDALPSFDRLAALHRTDPSAFERLRARLLDQAVRDAPQRHRECLTALVHQLNEARVSAPDEQAAAETAFRLMQQSVARLKDVVEHAREEVAGLQATVLLKQISMGATLDVAPPARRMRRHRDRM